MMKNPLSLPAQRACVVQFHTDAQIEQGEFRGRVEHLVSYQSAHFESLAELVACMVRVCQLPYRVPLERKMPPIDTCLVCDASAREQGLVFQELRILPGAHHRGEHSPGVMIDRMPQPPCTLFGPDNTPHLLQRGGA
jgi:hypothetical protein